MGNDDEILDDEHDNDEISEEGAEVLDPTDTERRNDFVEAFGSYVRNTEGSVDYREAEMTKLAKLSADEMLLMQASDLAAIFSGCVRVGARHEPLLVVKPKHPVALLIDKLIASDAGRVMCEEIACCLRLAQKEKDIVPFLYTVSKKRGRR